jgi:folate-dependent tRNA-U54 methylase TrmFO/GidA
MNGTEETVQFTGQLVGGEGYVAAAWGISLSILLAYVIITTLRLRRARAGRENA